MAGAGVKTAKQGRNVITGRLKGGGIQRGGPSDIDSGKASVIQLERELKVSILLFRKLTSMIASSHCFNSCMTPQIYNNTNF